MIGEDAVNSTTAMLEKLMQIILEIIRMQRDSQRYNSREAAKSSKENAKQPKIKFGEMKKTEYKKSNSRIEQNSHAAVLMMTARNGVHLTALMDQS